METDISQTPLNTAECSRHHDHNMIQAQLQCSDVRGTDYVYSLIALIHVVTVARIALVKPDKARGVEQIILQAAQRGQIGEKVRVRPVSESSQLKEFVAFSWHPARKVVSKQLKKL